MQLMKIIPVTFFLLLSLSVESQNVGIGTLSPTYPLDVNGRIRLRHIANTSGIWFNNSQNVENIFTGMYNDTIYGIYGNNTWRIGFDGKNARLGINQMTPTAPLSFANITGKKISLYHGTTGDAGFDVYGYELRIHSDVVYAATTFGYDDYTNGFTEKMRLTGSGRLGIGTNNPAATLDVAGTVKITDGSQGSGKILTSDANGNTSWQTLSESYGNTERFMFRMYQTYVNPDGVLTEDYNYGTVTKTLVFGNQFYLNFPKAGLYHLDIDAMSVITGDYSPSGDSKIISLQVDNYVFSPSQQILYSRNFSPFNYYSSSNTSEATYTRSMDVYLKANSKLRFTLVAYQPATFEQRITVIGHLIAE